MTVFGLKEPHSLIPRVTRVLLQVVPFLFFAYFAFRESHVDFGYFYYAFHIVWDKLPWPWMYDMGREHSWFLAHHLPVHQHNQYVYPPQFAVLLSWITVIPLRIAIILWTIISTLGFLSGALMMRTLARLNTTPLRRAVFYLTVLLNLAFWWDVIIGNANWLIFLLMSSSLYVRYMKKRPAWAGVLLGLSILFKVTPTFFILYLLVQREWKWITSTISTVVAGTAVAALTIGVRPLMYYATHLTTMTATSMKIGTAPYNSSLIGVLTFLKYQGVVSWSNATIHVLFLTYAVIIIGIIMTILRFTHRPGSLNDLRNKLALGLLPVVLLSPLLEGPHLLVAWISVWMVMGSMWDEGITAHTKSERTLIWVSIVGILAILSPLGWFLRNPFPPEYFLTMLLLFAVAARLAFHKRS